MFQIEIFVMTDHKNSRFCPRVCSVTVFSSVASIVESFVTLGTCVWFLASVSSEMGF